MESGKLQKSDGTRADFEQIKRERFWQSVRQTALSVLQPLLTAILLLALWQLVVVLFDIPRYLFPAPSEVIQKGIEYAPEIWEQYGTTLRSAVLGYLLAVAIAVPGSLIIAYSSFAQKAIYPGLVLIHMTPKVTLAPIVIAWLGFGLAPKLVITSLLCFMPIMLNGILAFRSIPPEVVYLAQSTGAGTWQMFWKVRLPNALPTLFVGLKHGASLALIGAVVAEYIGGNSGLAYFLILSLDDLQVDLGIAIMVAMTTIGLAMFFGMHAIESLAIPWHVSKRRATRNKR